jgi:23S rRNA (cytosine1962-C5)-methyltransferase
MKTIKLKAGKERSLLRRHPWIFESAIGDLNNDVHVLHSLRAGDTIRIESDEDRPLAVASYSPKSQIRARVWSFDPEAIIDHRFFKNAIRAALARRKALPIASNAFRAVHGESDGLPGVIVDVYNDTAVVQITSAGAERWKDAITQAIVSELKVAAIYERSDSSVRTLEGLEPHQGWLYPELKSNETRSTVVAFEEHSLKYEVDVASGQKTGFYLDQRGNRALFTQAVKNANTQSVLNCYCYTGGFTLAALAGDAKQVISVDSSALALQHAKRHVALNKFDASQCEFIDADVPAQLRKYRSEGVLFDAIVLDPPKFAPSAQHAERAARAYKDINRVAFHILKPSGLLFTFSCSGGIDQVLFQKIVASAASEAHADATILAHVGATHDHPHSLAFPEGEYLKGLLLRKM